MSTVLSFLTKRSRRGAFFAFALFVALIVFLFGTFGAAARDDGTTVSFLDVGQGDAILIGLGNGAQVLIDGGPPNGRLVAALGALLPPTDRTIEFVVLTHPELDHYGGLIELLRRYEVGLFAETGVAKDIEGYRTLLREVGERNVLRARLRAGDRIRYGARTFTVLSPDRERVHARETNDTSAVVAFEADGARFLFTGDISAGVERALSKELSPFDVLKVSHHGSKLSSTAEFLGAVRPTLALIGVGKNPYGHPTKEVLARLEAAGARVYRTDRDGTVTVRVEGGTLRTFVER
jgi:competence protein ComEC